MYFEIPLNLIKRKKFFELNKRSRNRVKYFFFYNIFFFINVYLKSYGLQISTLELIKCDDSIQNICTSRRTIKREYKRFREIFLIKNELNTNSNPDQQAIVLQNARDQANMSEISYMRFRAKINSISGFFKLKSIHKLNLIKNKMNKFFTIKKNNFGWYVDCREKICFTLKKIYQKLNGQISNNTFNIHLSGDGLVITKTKINLISFVFRVLNEQGLSTNTLYTLGLFEVTVENYESLKIALKEIIESLNELKSVEINNQLYSIDYTQGGDLKWISNINGINNANSINPCPWCKWNSKDGIKNPNKRAKYSIGDRTLDNAKESGFQMDGHKNPPIIDFIEYRKSIFDPLHLCLRITDKLFDKLIAYLDVKDKDSTFDLNKRANLKVLVDYVQDICKITEPFYFDQKDKKVTIRSLNEEERLRILGNLEQFSLIDLFPGFKNDYRLRAFNAVLVDFFKIFKDIKEDHSVEFNRKKLEQILNEWLDTFLLVNESNKITPYMHILVDHVPQFIEEYKHLNKYSMQSVEKLNFVIKQNYFKQTNRRRNDYVKQLIEKHNRIEFLNLNGTLEELNQKLLRNNV